MEFENVIAKLEEIYDILYYSLGVAELGIAGVVLLYGIIAGLIATILGMLNIIGRICISGYTIV